MEIPSTINTNNRFADFAKRIVSEFISFPCPGCLKNMPDGSSGLCIECFNRIPVVKTPVCPGCGAENDGIFEVCGKCLKEEKRIWKSAVALMRMEDYGRELLHRFKYKNDTSLARPFGMMCAEMLKKSGMRPDLIVPVPLHWTRSFTRGYNQTALVSQIISTGTGIPMKKLLRRVKRTPKQANLSGVERRKNLKGAFSATCDEICRNRVILLVDDVLTTGSTLSSASSALMDSGAKEINILILARG
ncbi:MAG: phosphoribosyltransferase family protein [Victivallales bacterium]